MASLRHSAALRGGLVAVLLLVVWQLLLFPLRDAGPYLDDFLFITLGRHLESPWPLLLGDATGLFFFRPLTLLFWWVSVQVAGAGSAAQYGISLGLHAVNGFLVYVLLRELRVSFGTAAAAALLFVAHPANFSTAAWLSDRFDLLATAFGVAALIAVERYRNLPRAASLAAATGLLLASILSKEVGFAFVPVAATLALWPSSARTSRASRLAVVAALAMCVLLPLVLRWLVIRDVAGTMFLKHGLLTSLTTGAGRWLDCLGGFLYVDQGNIAARTSVLPLGVALAVSMLTPRTWRSVADGGLYRCVAAGGGLTLAAIIVQTPITAASLMVPYAGGVFDFDSLAGCRFYYLAFVGIAMVLAAIADAVVRTKVVPHIANGLLVLAVVALVGMVAASRSIARDFTDHVDRTSGRTLEAAMSVLLPMRDVPPGCKVYLLAIPAEAQVLRDMLDLAIKQALPHGHPLASCFVQGEHTPWYHVLEARGLAPGAERPLEVMRFAGKPYPPLRVGNLEYFYLNAENVPELGADPRATFYSFDGARFVDVTEDVRSGRRIVPFYNNRPPY